MQARTIPLVLGLAAVLAGCGDTARLTVADGTGPTPQLPPPSESLLPTVNIAPARGWAAGATPVAAAGLTVSAYATGLDHPRWLYVLPNGDVLVAETNAPPKPEDAQGIRGWIMKRVMKQAGAATPSAEPDHAAARDPRRRHGRERSVFLARPRTRRSAWRSSASDFYVADTDAILRFPYQRGRTRIDAAAGRSSTDLPAGPINHHWTKNVIASPDGTPPLRDRRLEQQRRRERHGGRRGPRRDLGDRPPDRRAAAIFASGLRNPNGMALPRRRRRCGRS